MIFLPQQPLSNTHAAPLDFAATAPLVLLIDDDDSHGELIEFFLAREGFQVTRLSSGQAAWHYVAQEQPPSLVLLDFWLSYQKEHQLLRQIRTRTEWGGVPVMVMSEKSADHDIASALDHGANDCMIKPRQPRELVARVRNLLRRNPHRKEVKHATTGLGLGALMNSAITLQPDSPTGGNLAGAF